MMDQQNLFQIPRRITFLNLAYGVILTLVFSVILFFGLSRVSPWILDRESELNPWDLNNLAEVKIHRAREMRWLIPEEERVELIKEAALHLMTAFELRPESEHYQWFYAITLYQLATVSEPWDTDMMSESVGLIEAVWEKSGKSWDKPGKFLADHYARVGDLNRSVSLYKELIQKIPSDETLYVPLLQIHIQQGRWAEAARLVKVKNEESHLPTPRPVAEPRLPAPEHDDGDPGICRTLFSACSLVFELQPSSFTPEHSRVGGGRAREWGTTMWGINAPECQSFSHFDHTMKGVFDRSASSPATTRQLFRIRSVSNYVIDFCTLAASIRWGEKEQLRAFYNGMSDWLLDKLSTCDLPSSLNGLVDLALRIDARLEE